MVRRVGIAAALAVLFVPSVAHAYSWPVKPFDRMHPVRGGFNDPRYHLAPDLKATGSFHFGVDISVPDGTPVYAVEPGTVSRGAGWVSVRRPNRREFGYWHVRAVVKAGSHVVLHQLLGYTIPGWGHVHFAESVAGAYRNPLRPGALSPDYDNIVPVVAGIAVGVQDGLSFQASGTTVTGTVALVADVYDLPEVIPPSPWADARLVPGLVRWRLVPLSGNPTPWRLAADLRYRLVPSAAFATIFAPGTYQNKPDRPGDYRFWLTQAFNTDAFPNGSYVIEVEASDLYDNVARSDLPITIANQVTAP
jgi:hypothetical protein